MIFANGRCLQNEFSGVQRYAHSVISRLQPAEVFRAPSGWCAGGRGHIWEQFLLPAKLPRDGWLFCPANVGPLAVARQVVTIHDMATFAHPDWFGGAFARWYRFLLPRLARRAARILTVSEFSKREIVRFTGVRAAKVDVVYNGSDSEITSASTLITPPVRQVLDRGKPFIFYLGSMEPRKNLRSLLAAWNGAGLSSFDLVLAGGSLSRVFGDAQELPRGPNVHLLGRVADAEIELLLRGAEAFIYPSLYEGFGLPPLEAMRAGCLALVSEIPAIREVCGPGLDQGGSVIYFDPKSCASIATAMISCVSMDPLRKAQAIDSGRIRAASFSWKRCAEETLHILRSVSGGSGV